MPVGKIAKRLDRAHHSRQVVLFANLNQHHFPHRFVGYPAEIAKKASREPEVYTQPLRNSENPLPVRDVGKYIVAQPVSEYQGAFLVAGGAASALLAGESHKKLLTAFWAAHSCEAMLQVSAFNELVNSLPYNRPPEPEPHAVTIRIHPLELL